MSEHPNRDTQRDEIARIIVETPASVEDKHDAAVAFADALLAADLIVPPGLTAERLRAIAYRHRPQWANDHEVFLAERQMLCAWADALELRETPE